jgi:hypothetical protein
MKAYLGDDAYIYSLEVSGQLRAPAALSPGKSKRYPLDRKLDGPQSRSGRRGEKKYLAPPPGDSNSEPSAVHPVASRYTDCAIPAPNTIINKQILSAYSYSI